MRMNWLLQRFSCIWTKIRINCGNGRNGKLLGSLWCLSSMSLFWYIWTFDLNWLFIYRNLKKCGKKMPRYCDVNSDRKITLTEWLNCLQAQRISSPHHLSAHQSNHDQLRQTTKAPDLHQSSKLGRVGQNPFDSILKSD